jgi:hypothetical protein
MDRARPKHIAQPQVDLARPLAHFAAAATAAFLLLAVASCDGSPSEPPPPKTLIEVVNGAGQAAPAESTLPVAPSVRVTDTTGQPLENVAVTFETTRGGGILQGATATTGPDGVARLGSWTLGPGSGRQTVTVSARDARATVSASSTLWVAVGDNGVTATSPTGEVWTIRENPVDFRAWNAVATDSMWVAVGMGPTHGAISLDGIHWTGKNMPFTGHGVGIGWNGSRFVATGDSREFTAAISDNGDSWTGRLTPFTARGRGVAFGGGLWVATGEGGTSIATSPDGEEWTARASPFDTTTDDAVSPRGMLAAWNGSLWVAVGEGQDYRIATSPDGITWTGRESDIETRAHGVVWNGEMWMVVGERGPNSTATIVTSTDGIEWTRRPSPYGVAGWGVGWDGERFITVGTGWTIGISPDGESWTTHDAPFPTGRSIIWSGAAPLD